MSTLGTPPKSRGPWSGNVGEEWRRAVLPLWVYSAIVGAVSPLALLLLYVSFPDAAMYGGRWKIWMCDRLNLHVQVVGFPLVFTHVSLVGYWATGLLLSSKMSPEIPGGRDYAAMALLEYSAAALLILIPVISSGMALSIPLTDLPGKVTIPPGEASHPKICACAFRKILPLSRLSPIISFALGVLSIAVRPSRQAAVVSVVSVIVFLIITGLLAWISR